MGNCLSLNQTNIARTSDTIIYPFGGSVQKSHRTFTPVLHRVKVLQSEQLIHLKRQVDPHILSIACGFGEDALLYRPVFGADTHFVGIDNKSRFKTIADIEQEHNRESAFLLQDATNLDLEPHFDLITMRHPEPARNPNLWADIFIEAARFSQKSKAPILMTTFADHERQYFIKITQKMSSGFGVRLVTQFTNEASTVKLDAQGHAWGRDRFVAIFNPVDTN